MDSFTTGIPGGLFPGMIPDDILYYIRVYLTIRGYNLLSYYDVKTQVVAGMNYYLGVEVQNRKTGETKDCNIVVYQDLSQPPKVKITSFKC